MAVPSLLSDWAQFLANVATFLGVPIAIYAYLRDRTRERNNRELSTYCTVNSSFVEYLRLCLDNPHLSAAGYEAVAKGQPHEERDQELLIHMAVCMLESAYFLYRDHDSDFRNAQWVGWNEHMKLWCQNSEFRKRWPEVIDQYDRDFVHHITRLYDDVSEELTRSNSSLNSDALPRAG